MQELGKILCLTGVVIACVGLLLWKLGGKIPLGRLPGDISIQKPGFSFYFPVTTCIVISVILSLVFWLLRKL